MFRSRVLMGSVLVAMAWMSAGCKFRPARQPHWIQTAPGDATFAVSGDLAWMIRRPLFQTAMVRYPMAERILDTFLKQAHINIEKETGRVSFFALGSFEGLTRNKSLELNQVASRFVITLSDFRDAKALMRAMAEAFPPEGSLVLEGREYPLHVVMDINEWHIRAMLDDKGTVWLGDLRSLSQLTRRGTHLKPLQTATAWLPSQSVFQGFVHIKPILDELSAAASIPALAAEVSFVKALPKGVEGAAFSAASIPGRADAMRFDLIVTGTPQGIQETLPWMQRLVAAASSLQNGGGLPAPELVQEKERMALRCPMTLAQIEAVLNRLRPDETSKLPGGA